MNQKSHNLFSLVTVAVLGFSLIVADARPHGRSVSRSRSVSRGGGHRSVSRSTTVNRSTHVNRNVHVNRSRHVDVDVNRHHGYHGRPVHHGARVAAGVAVGVAAGVVVGAAIATPPRGYSTVYVSGAPYAYYGGTYYQPVDEGYVIAEPPVGAIVPTLPPGATATTVNGAVYYLFNGLYYQPVLVNGVTSYKTVRF
ncbi:MAG: DUF6515 family protein [Verrucomicrobiales bacterium]|nr:DUF6515 family protein [Verrucomicrobiales bacterium]